MFSELSGPKIGGGRHENIFKRLIYAFFSNNAPPGGGAFYQILTDVAITTCLQNYSKRTQKAYFWTSAACCLNSAPPK